jgi:hypothetical protein
MTDFEKVRLGQAIDALRNGLNDLREVAQSARERNAWGDVETISMYANTLSELLQGSYSDDEDEGLEGYALSEALWASHERP